MERTKISTIRGLVVLGALLWLLPSGGEAATIQVDCPSASLQAAVDKAKPGDILLVSGTCNENVFIQAEVQRITLDGQGKATIDGPDTKRNVIYVRGRDVTIKGFIVRGGRNGIVINVGGTAVVDGNTVENTGRHGVLVEQVSFARIINNTIRNNPRDGIIVGGSSYAYIGFFRPKDRAAMPNSIQNNGRAGIRVNGASSARINGNTITGNKRAGVRVQGASQASIGGNTINGNGGDGISIRNADARLGRRRGSGIFQLPNSTSSNNSGAGVRCRGNSSVDGRLGSLNGEEGVKDIDPSCVDSLKPTGNAE